MREDILNEIKDYYKDLKADNKNQEKKLDRLKELEEMKIIKEYLELSKENIVIKKDSDIMIEAYRKFKNRIADTNNIYVYLDTYSKEDFSKIDYYSSDAKFSSYKNIENEQLECINVEDRNIFEKINNVIFPETKETFESIQYNFIKNCLKEDQKKAVKKLIK